MVLKYLRNKIGGWFKIIFIYCLRRSCPWTSEFALRNWKTWTQIWSLARDKASSFIAPWFCYPPERRKSMHRDFFKNCKILPCLQLYHQHHSWLSDWKVRKKIHLKDWVEGREVGDSVERGDSLTKEFNLSKTSYGCAHLAAWKAAVSFLICGKVMLRLMCILIVSGPKYSSERGTWYKDSTAHEGNVSRSLLDFCFPFKVHSLWREVWGSQQDTTIWWHRLLDSTVWSQGPNSSYIHLVHK